MTTIPDLPEWETAPQPGRQRWQIDAEDVGRGLRFADEGRDETRGERWER